jgi:hypothetical protein
MHHHFRHIHKHCLIRAHCSIVTVLLSSCVFRWKPDSLCRMGVSRVSSEEEGFVYHQNELCSKIKLKFHTSLLLCPLNIMLIAIRHGARLLSTIGFVIHCFSVIPLFGSRQSLFKGEKKDCSSEEFIKSLLALDSSLPKNMTWICVVYPRGRQQQ